MILYSTNHQSPEVSLREAVVRGLPPDNGLYMPSFFPMVSSDFLKNIAFMDFNEMAFNILSNLFKGYIPETELQGIIDAAFDFDAPIHWLKDGSGVLELYHGPTLAFKDFGARFMGRLLEYFLRDEDEFKKLSLVHN